MIFDMCKFFALSREKKARFLFRVIQHCTSDMLPSSFSQLDSFVSTCYQSQSDLLTLPDEVGNLPIWYAYTKHLPQTFSTILELDTTPRYENRIICKYQEDEDGHATAQYFTDELKYIIYHLFSEDIDDSHELSIIHQMIPFLHEEDCNAIAEPMLHETAESQAPFQALSKLIEEGWDLTTQVENIAADAYTSFATAFVERIDYSEKMNIRTLFAVKGMLFTESILSTLHQYGDADGPDAFLCKEFVRIVRLMQENNQHFNFEHFRLAMHKLLSYGIDLRLYQYFDKQSLAQMLVKHPAHATACLDLLGRLDGPTAKLYRTMQSVPTTVMSLPKSQQTSFSQGPV